MVKKSGWRKGNLNDCPNPKAMAAQERTSMMHRMKWMTLEPQIRHIQVERGGSFDVIVTTNYIFIKVEIVWKMSIEQNEYSSNA